MTDSIPTTKQCSIGKETDSMCHKANYTKLVKLNSIEEFTNYEKQILFLRSEVNSDLIENICEHHKIFYLKKYDKFQTNCFDPFKCHKKKIKKSLRTVSLNFSDQINKIENITKSIPGQKICDICRQKLQKNLKLNEDLDTEETNVSSDSDQSVLNLKASLEKNETIDSINSSLTEIGQSPLKFHSMPSHSRSSYAKRKLETAYSTLRKKTSSVLEKEISPSKEIQVSHDIIQKANDMDILVNLMKEKLKTPITQREKIQLLTLAPSSWSRERVMEELNVSQYAVRQARDLLKKKGILALPDYRKGKKLDEDVVKLVTDFFQNDECSRIMPGKKDFKSISKNYHVQKRLLLSNLKELYSSFKSEYPLLKIGFSKFCMLRPKWCVFAGSSGTHSICICTYHQNVILLLHACHIEETYKDLISKLVCSTDNRDCMLKHCSKCPSNKNLKKFLVDKFEAYDPDHEIIFSQWLCTDRTELVRCTATYDEYITKLLEQLEKLIPYSFIAREQSKFFKAMKENLDLHTAIVLLDFSENFSFVIQDEVQGHHWANNSCSLHTVVIYTCISKTEKQAKATSICILSDDLEHDVAFVYETQKITIKYIKENFANVQNILYFSDGCAAQYKNCKNFFNLCCHKKDFALDASWGFFATSHGKSSCDGIGGTVKRLVARESLQRCYGDAIDSVDKVLKFCKTRVENILFELISKELISETRQKLKERFSKSKTIPGTRSFHHFMPLSENSIATKRTSSDVNYSLVFNFFSHNPNYVDITKITINSYIACIYDDHWFFGLVLSKDKEENDIKVKFMHPFGPAKSFYWPPEEKEDICHVPFCNIISCVSIPVTKGTGRMYYFEEKEVSNVEQMYVKHFALVAKSKHGK